jgi:hypothetical protein
VLAVGLSGLSGESGAGVLPLTPIIKLKLIFLEDLFFMKLIVRLSLRRFLSAGIRLSFLEFSGYQRSATAHDRH